MAATGEIVTPAFFLASLPHTSRFDSVQPLALGRAGLDQRIADLPSSAQAMVADMRHRLVPWREPAVPATALPEPAAALVAEQQAWHRDVARLRATIPEGAIPAGAGLAAAASALATRDALAIERLRLAHLWQAADRHGLGHLLDLAGLLIAVARWDAAIGWSAADSSLAASRLGAAAIARISPHV